MTRSLTVEVFEADNVTYVGTLAADRAREWLDDLHGEGSCSIESLLDHADEALLADGRVLRFCVDGTPRWAGLVEDRNITLADPSARRSGRVIGVTGRGHLAIFEDAVVLPELGFGRISPDNRYLGWMSRYYDHSTWGFAVELKQQSDPDDTKPWFGAPRGFTDGDAYWVGPTDGDVPGADPGGGTPGYMLLWGDYTVPVDEGGDYMASTTADDGFELYRDGDREAAESRVALWGETRPVPMQLDEGDHFFGVKVTNFDRGDNSLNVFGFILSLAQMLGGGVATGDVVARSSAGTRMLAFPASEPGMTVGHIMIVLIEENQAYDWHPDLTWDFTETEDSNGTPWPVELNVAFPVGASLGDVLRHLVDQNVAEFAMDPEGKVLHAYVQKGTDRTGSVTVGYGVNVNRLKAQHVAAGKNTTISRTAEGRWLLFENAGAVTSYGRRFVGMSLGSAPSDTSAEMQADAFISDHAFPVEAITDLQVEDPVFFDGTVQTGDLVIGPTVAGTATFRVHGLRFSEDDAGQLVCTPELVRERVVATLRLYDARSDCHETSPTHIDYDHYDFETHLHWSVVVEPFVWPAGTDGTFFELDMWFTDPVDPTLEWVFGFGSDSPIDPALVTGGFTVDSAGPLPTGIDYTYGVALPPDSLDGDEFAPHVTVFDGSYSPFDTGLRFAFDPASDPSWL